MLFLVTFQIFSLMLLRSLPDVIMVMNVLTDVMQGAHVEGARANNFRSLYSRRRFVDSPNFLL